MLMLLGLSVFIVGVCATLRFRPARQGVKVLDGGPEKSIGWIDRNRRTLYESSVALIVAGLIVLFLGFLMSISFFP